MNARNLALIASNFLQARWRWHHLRGMALERYQEHHAQHIVQYTLQHAPFYREHWSGHDVRQWRELPTVDKHLMMEHFDTFNTRGIAREAAMNIALQAERSRNFAPVLDGITVGLSSGTSGHRGLFLANPWEQAAWAGTILARTLHNVRPRRLRVAFFLRSNSNLYEQIGGILIQFRYFDLMLPLPEAVSALNTFRPDIIVGPPSLLAFLADERVQGNLRIQPERLISVAEVLEPHDKARLEMVFQAPVQQIYQCTEGLLAVSCAHDSLHIQEDVVAMQFEPLSDHNEDGMRVMPIVTDMWRRTQPIIRYRLNDVLQLETQKCACGSPFRVIRTIEGRCDDICYFESHTGGTRPFFPDTIRRMILLASPAIGDYQVIQEKPGHLHIYLSLSPSSSTSFAIVKESVMESVKTTLAQYDCRPATTTIEQGLPPPAPGIKRRRVQRIP
nr:F390 synthetase-related protein [Ktedonobacteraceae bacterium]